MKGRLVLRTQLECVLPLSAFSSDAVSQGYSWYFITLIILHFLS